MATLLLEPQPEAVEYSIYEVGFDSYLQTWGCWNLGNLLKDAINKRDDLSALDIAAPPFTIESAKVFSFGLAIGNLNEESTTNTTCVQGDVGNDITWINSKTVLQEAGIEGFDFVFFRPLGGISHINEHAAIKAITEGIDLLNPDGHFLGHFYTDHINSPRQAVQQFLEQLRKIDSEKYTVEFFTDKQKKAFLYHIHRL